METINTPEEMEVDIREIIHVVLSKLWLILLVGVNASLIMFCITKFVMTPIYQSETRIYVLNKQEESSVTFSELQTGAQLTNDYTQLIKSRPVMESVIKNLNLDLKYEEMNKKIKVLAVTDTRIISILVDDEDPIKAMNIANQIRDEASKHIQNVMNIEAVNVAQEANLPEEPYKPSPKKYSILAGILGIIVTLATVVFRYLLDDTIKTPDDIEKKLGMSTLACIPIMGDEKSHKARVMGKGMKKTNGKTKA